MISNPEDYQAAIARIETLMDLDPAPDTEEGMELNELAKEVAEYETHRFEDEALFADYRRDPCNQSVNIR